MSFVNFNPTPRRTSRTSFSWSLAQKFRWNQWSDRYTLAHCWEVCKKKRYKGSHRTGRKQFYILVFKPSQVFFWSSDLNLIFVPFYQNAPDPSCHFVFYDIFLTQTSITCSLFSFFYLKVDELNTTLLRKVYQNWGETVVICAVGACSEDIKCFVTLIQNILIGFKLPEVLAWTWFYRIYLLYTHILVHIIYIFSGIFRSMACAKIHNVLIHHEMGISNKQAQNRIKKALEWRHWSWFLKT